MIPGIDPWKPDDADANSKRFWPVWDHNPQAPMDPEVRARGYAGTEYAWVPWFRWPILVAVIYYFAVEHRW